MTLRRWMAPDLAMAGAALTLVFLLFLFQGGEALFRDSDTGWHIRTGELILAGIQLPAMDPFSFSRTGQPWFAWEWGADVLMALAYKAGRLPAVAWMYAVLIAASTWLWFRLTWVLEGDFLLGCLLASPMLTTVNIHWLARPHVMGWVLVLVCLLWLEQRRLGPLRWLALGCLWANVHGSFFLAPLLAGLYAAGRRRDWRTYAAAGGACAAGTLLNPYGVELHRHVFAYLGNQELLSRIGEFQTFNFQAAGSLQIGATLLLAAAGAALAWSQGRVPLALAAFLFVAIALRSARGLPLAALIGLPVANAALRRAAPAWLDGVFAYSANLRVIDTRFRGWAFGAVMAAVAWFALGKLPVGFPPDQFPVAAAAQLNALPGDARLLAPDKFGGYLIYQTRGQRKVYFDGRSDFYGVEFMKEYVRLVQVRPGWRTIAARHGFTHALLPPDYSLVEALAGDGWRELYRDGTAVLLASPAASLSKEGA